MAALCFSGMSESKIETATELTIKGTGYDPASITWTPVLPVTTFTGAVQIAAEFQVTRADGTVIAGDADDYLFIDAAGEMFPIPKRLALLLVRPLLEGVRATSPHEVKTP